VADAVFEQVERGRAVECAVVSEELFGGWLFVVSTRRQAGTAVSWATSSVRVIRSMRSSTRRSIGSDGSR
jgi:hypothetical protein